MSQAHRLQHKKVAFKADAVNDDGTFSGYGAVFGNVDSYRDVIVPGAFTNTINEIAASNAPLPALWQHDQDKPIGGYDALREDSKGLYVSGWLMIGEIAQAREAHALMKRKVVRGLSIGYYVREDSFDEKTNIRTLKELELVEISPCTFPANDLALVDQVKTKLAGGTLPTLREFEEFLREAGFSKSRATAIANRGLSHLLRSESDSAGEAFGKSILSILNSRLTQ